MLGAVLDCFVSCCFCSCSKSHVLLFVSCREPPCNYSVLLICRPMCRGVWENAYWRILVGSLPKHMGEQTKNSGCVWGSCSAVVSQRRMRVCGSCRQRSKAQSSPGTCTLQLVRCSGCSCLCGTWWRRATQCSLTLRAVILCTKKIEKKFDFEVERRSWILELALEAPSPANRQQQADRLAAMQKQCRSSLRRQWS